MVITNQFLAQILYLNIIIETTIEDYLYSDFYYFGKFMFQCSLFVNEEHLYL